MARQRPKQLELELPKWGGKRKGAGRKPKNPNTDRKGPGVSHLKRSHLNGRWPLHVTLRTRREVWNLRSHRSLRKIAKPLYKGNRRDDFRLIEFSIQGNHLHFIVEAETSRALSRGMQGLEIRIARALNTMMSRHGAVFADRFHARVLRTPTEVAHARSYVLGNFAHHAAQRGVKLPKDCRDPYSSQGIATHPIYLELVLELTRARAPTGPPPFCARPTVWLLRNGRAD